MKEQPHCGNLTADERIILERIFERQDMNVWLHLMRLKKLSVSALRNTVMTSAFRERYGISGPAEGLIYFFSPCDWFTASQLQISLAGRMIRQSQRPLPDSTQHSPETDRQTCPRQPHSRAGHSNTSPISLFPITHTVS